MPTKETAGSKSASTCRKSNCTSGTKSPTASASATENANAKETTLHEYACSTCCVVTVEHTGNVKRSWNNPTREPWNPVIKACVNAIDHHTRMYLETKDRWHLDRAQTLREYVSELKDWIHDCEGKT